MTMEERVRQQCERSGCPICGRSGKPWRLIDYPDYLVLEPACHPVSMRTDPLGAPMQVAMDLDPFGERQPRWVRHGTSSFGARASIRVTA